MDFDDIFVSGSDRTIGHLGLVAGCYDSLKISEIVDNLIPKNGQHKLTHGDALKGMVINGLGYIERRLYLFPGFFTDIAVERLFHQDVCETNFNDDVIGRTLDTIHAYGETELFNQIILPSLENEEFSIHLVNADTTNFSVYGEYDGESQSQEISITHGHPKDGRWDLKRFSLGMATNQYGIPLMLQTFSGNESDKKALLEIINKVRMNLNTGEKVIHVADAAFYTEDNIQTLGLHTFWVSRVPMTISEAIVLRNTSELFIPCKDERYSWFTAKSEYAGIPQNWTVFHSNEQQKKKEPDFEKRILIEFEKTKKSLKHLCSQRFACEPDAKMVAEEWIQNHPKVIFSSFTIDQVRERLEKKRGRPKKDEQLVTKFIVNAEISLNQVLIEQERSILGRFILATNDLDLDPDTSLSYYKGQSQVEKGFRFLKDKTFRVSDVFLKNIGRIQALAMVMVLCLYVYAVAEYRLRKGLREANETIPDQTGKPTQKPTMRWIFFLFRRVKEISLRIEGMIVTKVLNLNDILIKIIRFLGPHCEKYYSL
ncbi:IS1634 family transposase [uncultured Methanospirillum sp.]|uniref:IS1634 family transposase n=1 Tax=uncultured Methanospirillum sp. TaxID=262503 RepID=UPI0029C715F7|nr:IS1634 family transposase [uncultured Methanospirillum sp.]